MVGKKQDILFIIVLFFCCLSMFFLYLGDRPLWDIDEGMHALTSKIMVESGDWITPRFNGEPFFDKPILFNWLVAISFLIFGFTEFAARLPAALLGTGCVFITYVLGRSMFNRAIGFMSGVILATSIEFIILSRVVIHDIALVFFITLGLYFFYTGFKNNAHRRTNILLFYASAGFATLAKGPVALLLLSAIIFVFLLFRQKLSFIKEMHIPLGLAIFFLIVSPWYILLSLKNPGYLHYFIIEKNLYSFIGGKGAKHLNPFYYYLVILIGGFFPWSFFLPAGLINSFRGGLKNLSEGPLFCIVWFVIIFFFFSVAKSKLSTYILPLFPAISIIVAVLWYSLMDRPAPRLRLFFMISAALYSAFFVVSLAYLLLNPPTILKYKYGIDLNYLNYTFGFVCLVGILAFLLFLGRRYKSFFSMTVGTVFLLIIPFIVYIFPMVSDYRSTKQLGMDLDALVPQKEKLVFYQQMKDSILFYTEREAIILHSPDQLKNYLSQEKKVYLLAEKRKIGPIKQFKDNFFILKEKGNKIIISNRPN